MVIIFIISGGGCCAFILMQPATLAYLIGFTHLEELLRSRAHLPLLGDSHRS